MSTVAAIDSDAILWRTRGKHWDYAFVRTPRRVKLDGWYDFHTQTFSGALPTSQPMNKGFIALVDGRHIPCVCTAFQDTDRVDIAGRPISHFITWFPDQASSKSGIVSLPCDWGRQVVAWFDTTFQQVFELTQDNLSHSAYSNVQTRLAATAGRAQQIQLTGEAVPIPCDESFELRGREDEKLGGEILGQSNAQPANAAAIERAIIEGEAYALGSKIVPLPSLFSFLTSDGELPERIAKSFGGSKTDKLVMERIPGIRDRVRNTKLPSYPRKGFDAIVDVLKETDLNWRASVDQCCVAVASLLKAAPDDEAVRNIVLRVKRLREVT